MEFYFCENCKEFFDGNQILVENGQPRCPHCGTVVKQAQAHIDRREK
jgi:DNA-directed RNA polymerase subunit RPC12/RpoP